MEVMGGLEWDEMDVVWEWWVGCLEILRLGEGGLFEVGIRVIVSEGGVIGGRRGI